MPMDRERETYASNRRGFLRGLTRLPLIGGGVTLIGAPTAVAEPCTSSLLQRYSDWLVIEYGETLIELAPIIHGQRDTHPQHMEEVRKWRREWCQLCLARGIPGAYEAPPAAPPSSRAALVLATVGCDWREGGR